MTYPIDEVVTGGIVSGVNNAAGFFFLLAIPHIDKSWHSLIMSLTVVFATGNFVSPLASPHRSLCRLTGGNERVLQTDCFRCPCCLNPFIRKHVITRGHYIHV